MLCSDGALEKQITSLTAAVISDSECEQNRSQSQANKLANNL